MWAKPFWDCHCRDMADASYNVFCSESCSIILKISGGVLSLECEDCKLSCNDINGSDGYDFSYILSEEDSHKLLVRLRLIHGINKPLEKILKEEFGHDEGSIQFRMRCSRAGIRCEFFSYGNFNAIMGERKTMNEKRIKYSVKKFMKNPYWKEYLESAPSEACRRYVELEFYYSDCLGEVDNYEEFKTEMDRLEQKFDYSDWKHLYNHCANNPKKAYYKKKLDEFANRKTD